ncbi:MAG: toxin-antitoxin system HicB family antitoxin [Lachnospiraceae bacterium]|jgi:hypothetical protein|nr:toxin-antitoxin system HicB family antitoxin [Lachnospiraceae bacterium]MDD4524520.1 toxin-antitoxin system HicB family antitoxin [Lachnospiraceae bacterium]
MVQASIINRKNIKEAYIIQLKDLEYGFDIPKASTEKVSSFSGKISLRISPYTHRMASALARSLGISLNAYFNDAIVAYSATVAAKTSVATNSTALSKPFSVHKNPLSHPITFGDKKTST